MALSKIKLLKLLIGVLMAIIFCSHLPLLIADIDEQVDAGTRGCYTDEGLYTDAIRNQINYHDNTNSGNLTAATPLYSGILYAVCKITGVKLSHIRLASLCIAFLPLLFLLLMNQYQLAGILLVTTYIQFRFFYFSHCGITAIYTCSFSLLLFIFLMKSVTALEYNKMWLLAASLISFSAFMLKIQNFYFLPVPILFYTWNYFFESENKKESAVKILWSAALLLLLLATSYLFWYLPNKETLNATLTLSQSFISSSQGSFISSFYNNLKVNKTELWNHEDLRTIYLLAIFATIGLFYFLKRKKLNKVQQSLFMAVFLFFIFEHHKLIYQYCPQRYTISLMAAGLMLLSIFLWKLIEEKSYFFVLFLLVAINFYSAQLMIQSFKNLSYDTFMANKYFENKNLKNETVLGQWAGTCNWKSGAKTYPIMLNEEKDLIQYYHPKSIIIETSGDDISPDLKHWQNNLPSLCDSIHTFYIKHYELKCYWLKQY